MLDKLMKKYGYEKTDENRYGAYYKKREPQGYDHIVCVISKASGKHLMQSYDAQTFEVNNDFLNEAVGVEIPVLLLMWPRWCIATGTNIPVRSIWGQTNVANQNGAMADSLSATTTNAGEKRL